MEDIITFGEDVEYFIPHWVQRIVSKLPIH